MEPFSSHFGSFELLPLHHHPKSPLQAWNAADELILSHITELTLDKPRALLVNDQYGALAISLHQWQPWQWNDSYCSKLAIKENYQRNQLEWREHNWINSETELNSDHHGKFDLIAIKIPKNLTFLRYQLSQIRNVATEKTLIVTGGMIKHLSQNMIETFEQMIGPSHTSLAKKKARLIFSCLNASLTAPAPNPSYYDLPGLDLQLTNYPSVFSQQKLDIGTRFLLENFPDVSHCENIIDLGCGNGALGIFAASKNPKAKILFTDESYLALKSAKASAEKSSLKNDFEFIESDGLNGTNPPLSGYDLVLCNPPFHQGNNVESQTAMRMFRNARKALSSTGRLIVVGNRHLGYHQSLKRYFKQVTLLASNKKFVILQAS